MGSCFSTQPSERRTSLSSSPTAKVITSDGRLREYSLPATASLALDRDAASSPSFFLCHSDALSYDKLVPVMDLDDHLLPGNMYFILPKSMLARNLSAPDMAAMAVLAATALSGRGDPVVPSMAGDGARSVRRLHRYTSTRAKMAVRSFRLRLATIYESAKDDSRFS